ncbi:hypothetical protein [Streptomyces sp. VB1]|uniref:hypothetical protein n=1 Tax=Streptomyces sp. VB1 TaxID=2986803 RepID=UPI002242561F|nr:hypothetical protein [Streptomyces sp. VB1]UZI29985.1 hypothetical protein OH133_18655 [Streptomyces sp. VB1]
MANTFRASLYTPLDMADSRTAKTLWKLINNPIVAPGRFDSIERARIEFDGRNYEAARDIYSAEDVLFVKGENAKFLAMFTQLTTSLAKWTFWWELEAMTGPSRDKWLHWLYELVRKLPPYYGFACSVGEYEAKHKIVDSSDEGNSIRMAGVSAGDFHKFLPGVYWLTIFGAELVSHFDEKLEALPDVRRIQIPPSQVAILLDSPAVPESMGGRLRTEAHLAEMLDAKYFFDRAKIDAERQLVPPLARVMREASR